MPDLNQIKQGEQGRATSRGQPRGEPAMTVLSRLDVRPTKKYTSALS